MPANSNIVFENGKFKEAINVLKGFAKVPDNEYDGLIIKQLPSSDTISESGRSHQVHIAITGDRMEIFPAVSAYRYLDCPASEALKELKSYFLLQITGYIYKYNILEFNSELANKYFSTGNKFQKIQFHVKKARRRDNYQIELGASADSAFMDVLKKMRTGDAFVFLKRKGTLDYDVLCLRKDVITRNQTNFDMIDKKCFLIQGSTMIDSEDIINNTFKGFLKFGFNKLFYGVPGCGKSYSVDKFIENEGISKSFVRRVVFHPDYTYSDFVGQIMPTTKETQDGKQIEYPFVPGPFTDILKVAYENPEQKCVLVIEELNRGNAPAIFGDLFQLLDREEDPSKKDYKWSKYHVTNKDIAENAIFERNDNDFSVRIPPNLAIMATMNTSDQNVFSMDTAFQRRWQMQHIRNVFTGEHADKLIEGTLITWKAFATTVNELLTEKSTMFGNSEDKCLGAYFAIDAELEDRQRFAEKVLKYLWDDAFKMEREIVFGKSFKSLSSVIESFEDATGDALKIVLKDEVYKAMLDKSTPAQVQAEEVADEEIIEQE